MKITFEPIGYVHNQIAKRHDMPSGGVVSEIHILPKYRRALFRIGKEKSLWILSYLHHGRRDVLVAKPRKSTNCGLRVARGVFCIRSPDRPNPIALTDVELVKRKGLVLYVQGLDVIDGTPVIDIKSVVKRRTVLSRRRQ